MSKRLLLLATVALGTGVLAAGAADWPQWRGPDRDNKVTGFTEPKTWPKELTKKWTTKVGLGDASPVLVGDKIYVFTRDDENEIIWCLDAAKGTEVWKDKYAAKPANVPMGEHKGPRSTPAVADGKVCTFGVAGVVSCLDAAKGMVLWRKDTKEWPGFYTSASPIIVDGSCILHIGKDGGRGMEGKGAIIAYDLATGDEKWKWSGDGPGYASPVLMTVDKTKQLVTLTEKSVVGIGAADGKLLWQVSLPAGRMLYNSITPIVDGQTVVYAREGTGTIALKVEKKDDAFATKEVWNKKDSPGKYNTPVLKDGLLFGLAPSGRGATYFYCMKAETGEVLWKDDKNKRGECGAVFDAGTVLLALTSDSNLVVFKPNDKEYAELAKYKVADSPTWACPIIAGNRVFVKDKDSVTLWTME
jgi:outer membrane protein assembly factor BamB